MPHQSRFFKRSNWVTRREELEYIYSPVVTVASGRLHVFTQRTTRNRRHISVTSSAELANPIDVRISSFDRLLSIPYSGVIQSRRRCLTTFVPTSRETPLTLTFLSTDRHDGRVATEGFEERAGQYLPIRGIHILLGSQSTDVRTPSILKAVARTSTRRMCTYEHCRRNAARISCRDVRHQCRSCSSIESSWNIVLHRDGIPSWPRGNTASGMEIQFR